MPTKMQYNSFVDVYSRDFVKYNQESIQAYFKHFNFNLNDKKILDLGCGTGYDLSIFKEKRAHIYGIDSSKEMVKVARKTNPEGIIKVSHFKKTPFEADFFDVVASKWALQTTDFIEPIYKEILRVLKPGGKLIFLACHPIRQFLEKKKYAKNYFKKEVVESVFFSGQVTALEYSHTFNEYFSKYFFDNFILESYEEGFDSAAEAINNDTYPSYFIINAKKNYHS